MIIEKYGVRLQTVDEDDAEIIVGFRTDVKRKRFISETDANVTLQKQWIHSYQKKEKEKKEFYFIATDEDGVKFATYRVYNMESDICEIGSWVSKPEYSNLKNSIKVDIIMKEFVFGTLNYSQLTFEVNKQNKSVIKYHKLFDPSIVNETEENYYFILKKQNFLNKRSQIFKNLK